MTLESKIAATASNTFTSDTSRSATTQRIIKLELRRGVSDSTAQMSGKLCHRVLTLMTLNMTAKLKQFYLKHATLDAYNNLRRNGG